MRAGRDEFVMPPCRHVIVVEIEAPRRKIQPEREGVQLIQGLIADEMTPERAVRRPPGLIDEDRHAVNTMT